MYIRKTKSTGKNGKVYTNYLLVESVSTPKGPRQKTICSLGNLKPRPKEEWIQLARKVERALAAQRDLLDDQSPPDPEVQDIVRKAQKYSDNHPLIQDNSEASPEPIPSSEDLVSVHTDQVTVENARELGPVHVGSQMYDRLGIEEILKESGLSQSACDLTRIQVLNRLIFPASEHAMPDWVHRTALGDILGRSLEDLSDDALYLNLDRILPLHESLEKRLSERENDLFSLENTLFFYDLTSTYFEGQMQGNAMAQRGYSRDKRGDCKQVVVGFAVNNQGFPRAHEVFDGNRTDSTTVGEMLDTLARRVGLKPGATVIVDRGMAFDKNLAEITERGLYYIVACRQSERKEWQAELEDLDGWQPVLRETSPTNPAQKKSEVFIKPLPRANETLIACISEGRKAKDRAIREKQEQKLLVDLRQLQKRVEGYAASRQANPPNSPLSFRKAAMQDQGVWVSLGRLKERYPRTARYYEMEYDPDLVVLKWQVAPEKLETAKKMDGSYLLKTNRTDLTADQIWKTYTLLTRAESAFRDMKSPLSLRPIFHQKAERMRSHVLLCVLAYHLLVAIEHSLRGHGDHRSWETVREVLRTHQAMTVVLPTSDGEVLRIRRGTTPEVAVSEVYARLSVPCEAFVPEKEWEKAEVSK